MAAALDGRPGPQPAVGEGRSVRPSPCHEFELVCRPMRSSAWRSRGAAGYVAGRRSDVAHFRGDCAHARPKGGVLR